VGAVGISTFLYLAMRASSRAARVSRVCQLHPALLRGPQRAVCVVTSTATGWQLRVPSPAAQIDDFIVASEAIINKHNGVRRGVGAVYASGQYNVGGTVR